MLPFSLEGVWAAATPAILQRRWVPTAPALTEHYFLVIAKNSDGTLDGFIRNPESNWGASIGTRTLVVTGTAIALLASGDRNLDGLVNADGTVTLHKISASGNDLTFHRATGSDLRWFYPLSADRWSYREPEEAGDGWRVGTLRDEGMREAPIATVMNSIAALRAPELRSPYIQSMSVARHGRLVLDQYFYGFSAGEPHDVRSAGKSVTTLMVGRAISDTNAFSPSSTVLSLLPGYLPVKHDDSRKAQITVADLMTMSSGLACDDNDDASPGNEDTMQNQPIGTDWYRYTLDLPMAYDPGTRAIYCTAGINLLGAVVETTTGIPLDRYFRDRFAVPMNFGTYAMWLMPPPSNAAYMGGGDFIRPRDFLKFAQLILDGGRWRDRQIVDRNWIDLSILPRSAPEGEGDRYGYGWHLSSVEVDGRSYDVVNAGGNGGQLAIAVPALSVAIMVTAGNYGQYPVWRNFLPQIVTAVVRSCR
ncbi:MAG TPA: serine hydrolase [Candidatus Cybelea sp.]|jgi:CubicO group peptidase (beta-lactamase class C family)|nr:serine hydrolase [Candidatus Cybelea sp.]